MTRPAAPPPPDLMELRRLAEAAHREPWDYWDLVSWDEGDGDQAGMMRPAPFTERENAAFIAAANPDTILALLDLVTVGHESIASLNEALNDARSLLSDTEASPR